MASKLAEAFVELTAKDDKLKSKVDGARTTVEQSMSSMTGRISNLISSAIAPMAGVLGVTSIFKGLYEVDRMGDFAAMVGVASERLQELHYAAQIAGSSAEEVDSGMVRMQRAIAEAADQAKEGKGPLLDLFNQIGIDVNSLKGMNPADAFLKLIDSIKELPNGMDKVNVAFQLFGRGGVGLVNLINRGSSGINELAQDLRSFGGVLDEAGVNKAGDATDALDRLKAAFYALRNVISVSIADYVIGISNAIVQGVASIRQFDAASGGLLSTLAKVTAMMVGFKGAGIVFAKAMSLMKTGFGIVGAHPIIAMLAAIAYLIGIIWSKMDDASKKPFIALFKQIGGLLLDAFKGGGWAIDQVTAALSNLVTQAANSQSVVSFWKSLKGAIQETADVLKIFRADWTETWSAFTDSASIQVLKFIRALTPIGSSMRQVLDEDIKQLEKEMNRKIDANADKANREDQKAKDAEKNAGGGGNENSQRKEAEKQPDFKTDFGRIEDLWKKINSAQQEKDAKALQKQIADNGKKQVEKLDKIGNDAQEINKGIQDLINKKPQPAVMGA